MVLVIGKLALYKLIHPYLNSHSIGGIVVVQVGSSLWAISNSVLLNWGKSTSGKYNNRSTTYLPLAYETTYSLTATSKGYSHNVDAVMWYTLELTLFTMSGGYNGSTAANLDFTYITLGY